MCIFPAPSLSEYPAVLVLVLVVRLTGSPVGVEHVLSVTPGVLPLLCDVIETNPDSTGSVWQTRTTAINNGKNSIQVKVTSKLWSNLSSYKFCYKVWPSKKMKSPGRVFKCTDFRSQEPKYCVLHCFEHCSFLRVCMVDTLDLARSIHLPENLKTKINFPVRDNLIYVQNASWNSSSPCLTYLLTVDTTVIV